MVRSSNSSCTIRRIMEFLPTAASPTRQPFVLMRWASGIGGVVGFALDYLKGPPDASSERTFFSVVLLRAAMRLDHRLILALDLTDPKRAFELAGSVRSHVDAVKVGWPLVLAGGLDVLRTLAKSGYVLCDFKIADIPNTNRLIVEQTVDAGASGIICHGFVGEDSVRACVDAAGGKDVFVLVEISHPGGVEYTAQHAEVYACRGGQPRRAIHGDARRDAGRHHPPGPKRPAWPVPVRPASPSARAVATEGIVAGHPWRREEGGRPHGQPLPFRPSQSSGAVHFPRQARLPERREVPYQPESAGAFERVRPQAEVLSEEDSGGGRKPDGLRRDGAPLLAGGAPPLQWRTSVRRP